MNLELGGVRFALDPAAVSAVRYRAEYGGSIMNYISQCKTAAELERRLLQLCLIMAPATQRPELRVFARLARRDGHFLQKGLAARDALLAEDPLWEPPPGAADTEPFDEYKVLALMAAAGLDFSLLYEMPILHLVALVSRCFALRGEPEGEVHALTEGEFETLFPRMGNG